jgi:homoserine kinase
MKPKAFTIIVPASTANLGPGFDSIGVALNLFLTLQVELASRWEIYSNTPELMSFPKDERHFIYQVAKRVSNRYKKTLTPCKVQVESEIPLARGLGSSAAAIIAGIELANQVGRLELTSQEKLELATELEGHPDNVGAALYGGLVIGSYHHGQTDVLAFPEKRFEVVAFIPRTMLLTKESRQVLPSKWTYQASVAASAIANLLVAALLSGNWRMVGKMMESDLFHHPYRQGLIPQFNEIKQYAMVNGAIGVAISGAGPTVIALIEKGNGHMLKTKAQSIFPDYDIKALEVADHGIVTKKSDSSFE